MNFRRFFLIHLILFTINIFSQNNNDSINIKLKEKLEYYKNTNSDSLLSIAKKLEQSKDDWYVIVGLSAEAYAYYREKDYIKSEEASIKLLNKANSNLSIKNNKEYFYDGKAAAYNRLFWIKNNQENYTKAYEYLLLMEKTNESRPNKNIKYLRYKLTIKTSKAIIKKALKMEEDAKNILLAAYNDMNSSKFESINNDNFFIQQRANISNSLGNTYMTLFHKDSSTNYIDSAAFYYDKAFLITKLFKPPHKDSDIIYSFRKTEILIAKKKYKKAINEINKYSRISNGYHYKHREYFQKAICFHNLNITDSTIHFAKKLINDNKEKCKRSKLITVYDILSKEYNKLNKIDSAFKYSQLTLKQFNLAKSNKEKTYNLLYTNNFKQAQVLNKKIKDKEASKQNNLIITFIALILILLSLTFFFLRKEKKQKYELINQLNTQQSSSIDVVEKKEYNIDDALENKILDKINDINKNFEFLDSNFSISSITKDLKTNSTYVSFVFNKHYKESFKQYFTRRKIDYIINKLRTDSQYRKYSIQGLAQEVGYTNASAFSRAFKKQVGITPSAFLKTLD
ncbi:AraC family transcriptional regulator [uncultured Tenacibaculum sp.]|uniref:helix-turn-helix domain-containing protein n=1 Tax=uncultured Tenacibaculum sp. TaxID=174713 RepID=UPI002602439C|nr:AraC family transcriptional regulator [uncultured Tenacibaculum sp.]